MTQHDWSDCDSYSHGSSSSDEEGGDHWELNQEEWEDWHSEELLNDWMSIVEYHENLYLPLPGTFNEFCDFQFFSLGYK